MPNVTKKQEIELAVAKAFVDYYNSNFGKDFVKPVLGEDPPDCISYSASDPKTTLKMEVMKSSPDETASLNKTHFYEITLSLNEMSDQLKELAQDVKRRKAYEPNFSRELVLLLEQATIHFGSDDKDMVWYLKELRTQGVQKQFADLGYKEIWYVTPKKSYKFYPCNNMSFLR